MVGVDVMNNQSNKAFSLQLEKLLQEYQSYSKLSYAIGIPSGTLKSWILKNRSPKIDSIDLVANRLGCFSYELLSSGELSKLDIRDNDSRKIFVKNLNKIFIANFCHTQLQKYTLLSNAVSNDALISYLRNKNYRKPTLEVLDKIANELNIPTFMLIKEDLFDEEKDLRQ